MQEWEKCIAQQKNTKKTTQRKQTPLNPPLTCSSFCGIFYWFAPIALYVSKENDINQCNTVIPILKNLKQKTSFAFTVFISKSNFLIT